MNDPVLVAIKHQGEYHWYSSERELWVLDWLKWYQSFEAAGYSVPEPKPADRFGLTIVNEDNCDTFLAGMKPFEVKRDALAELLAQEYPNAGSWWDVPHLFPVLFVDFDAKHVRAFYSEGTPLEKYVPDGWKAEFVDFADDLPAAEKYWVQGGQDLLRKLIEAGRSQG